MDKSRIESSLAGIKRRLLEDHNCSEEVPKSLIKEVASRLLKEKLEDTVFRCLRGLDYNELKELTNEKERQEGQEEKGMLSPKASKR